MGIEISVSREIDTGGGLVLFGRCPSLAQIYAMFTVAFITHGSFFRQEEQNLDVPDKKVSACKVVLQRAQTN